MAKTVSLEYTSLKKSEDGDESDGFPSPLFFGTRGDKNKEILDLVQQADDRSKLALEGVTAFIDVLAAFKEEVKTDVKVELACFKA